MLDIPGASRKPTAPQKAASFSIAAWREEEEERKRKKAVEAQQAAQKAREQELKEQLTLKRLQTLPTGDKNAPSNAFQARASQLKAVTLDNPAKDPITRYQKLVLSWGKERVGQRMAAIADKWNSTCGGYNGSNVIWELTSSQYTLDEIGNMIDEAAFILNDAQNKDLGTRAMNIEEKRVLLRNRYNLKSHEWKVLEEVFRAQEEAELPTMWEKDPVTSAIVMSMFVPLGWLGAAGAAAKIGLGAVRTAQAFTAGSIAISAAAEDWEGRRLDTIEGRMLDAEDKLAYSGSPLSVAFDSPFLATDAKPSVYEQFKNMRRNMMALNTMPEKREDIATIQKYYHSIGVGTDLEAGGIFTPAWQSEIIDAAQETTRLVYEEQRAAIEAGDAPYHAPINGDPYWTPEGSDPEKTESEGWPQWFSNREIRLAEQERLAQANPDRYAFWQTSGIPTTKLELEAWQNRIKRNGWLQALYGGLLQVGLTAGQTWQAAGAALNLRARQAKDPEYQAYQKALFDYVAKQDFKPTAYFNKKPDAMNEAFCRTEITLGYLKDDPEAKELLARLDNRQNALITDRYAPDYLLTMGYAVGADYDEVRQFGLEHPDAVRAFTVGVDALLAYANPIGRTLRAVGKPTVPANFGAWMNSVRSSKFMGRWVDNLLRGDEGAAVRVMGGSEAQGFTNFLYRITTTKKGEVRVDPKSEIPMAIARDVLDAVEQGKPQAVADIMRGASNDAIDAAVNAAGSAGSKARIPATGTAQSIQEAKALVVAKAIAARQSKYKDAISRDVLFERADPLVGQAYVDGRAIFPYLRDNRLIAPKRPVEWMQRNVAAISSDWLRTFVTKAVMPVITRAPVGEIEFRGQGTLDRIYDAALCVSQDAAWASRFRNRWAAAKTEFQYRRLIEDLDLMYTKKYKTKDALPSTDLESLATRVGEAGGQRLAPNPEGNTPGTKAFESATIKWTDVNGVEHRFNPEHPELLTEYLSRDSKGELVYKQAVPDTVYQMYAARVHRASLWAPYNTAHASGMAKGMLIAENILGRYPIQVAHRLSTPLRQWTVAMGAPLLFQKHALTDTFRSTVELQGATGPFHIFEAFGIKGLSVRGKTIVPEIRSRWARELNDIYAQLPADLVTYIQHVKARAHSSEAQWLSGNRILTYRPKTIWKDGKLVDINGSADALVRLTRGDAFKVWADGGAPAVEAWLQTAAGKKFLAEGSWGSFHKALQKELELAGGMKVKQRDAQASIAEEFMETIVRQEWERLDTALPNIMPVLKDMAINGRVVNAKEIKELIAKNPTDNAVLSTPVSEWGDFTRAGYIIGKAMFPNKWNRDVMFDATFTRLYRKLTKDGMEAENAARVSADVAELQVARVHFDLSNALQIEAKHRWLAWFATKHRLFGTYMMKLAIERPMLAAIVPELADWMEERNEAKGVSEYDKHDLVLDVGGKQVRLNLSPLMWFAEFPLESSLGLALERVAEYVLEGPVGVNLPSALKPSPAPFGMSLTRGDALIYTLWDAFGSSKDVKDDPSLTAWLNALPENRRLQWRRLINNQRAYAKVNGEDITAFQAFNKARAAAWHSEMWQAFKMYSGRVVGEEQLEVERLLREFSDEKDEEKARQMLRDNPVLSLALNASMDPVEKQALDEGFRVFNGIYADYMAAVEDAADRGTLIAEYKNIQDKFNNAIEIMTNQAYEGKNLDGLTYNPTFAKYFGEYDPKEFREALGLLMPYVPVDSVLRVGSGKNDLEKQQYVKDELRPAFEAALAEYGLEDADKSLLLYQRLEDKYINIPLAKWTGENPYSLAPYSAQSVARLLAKGGTAGVYRKDQFLQLVEDSTFRSWMSAGIGSNGKPSSSHPMMAYMSGMKLDALGWTYDPAVDEAWTKYAEMEAAIEKWRQTTPNPDTGEKGVDRASNLYKQVYSSNMGPLVQELMKNDSWANEYRFSQLRLDERLRLFGVGEGDSPEEQGMNDFLTIVEDMWDELDRTPNPSTKKAGVTPGAQTGGPVVVKYLEMVGDLALENDRWWQTFKSTYPLSKFGFVTKWHTADAKYKFLYSDEGNASAEEEEESLWFGGGN